MELDVEIFVMITYTHVNIEFGPCVHTYTQFSERCLYHVDQDVVGATLRRSNSKHTRETRHFAEKKCSSLAFSSSSTTMPPSAQQKKITTFLTLLFSQLPPTLVFHHHQNLRRERRQMLICTVLVAIQFLLSTTKPNGKLNVLDGFFFSFEERVSKKKMNWMLWREREIMKNFLLHNFDSFFLLILMIIGICSKANERSFIDWLERKQFWWRKTLRNEKSFLSRIN